MCDVSRGARARACVCGCGVCKHIVQAIQEALILSQLENWLSSHAKRSCISAGWRVQMGRQYLLPQWQLRSSYLCTCRRRGWRLHWLCCFAGIEFLLGVQKNWILRSNGRTPTQNGHMCHKVSTATIIAVSVPQVSHGMRRAQGPNVKALTSKQTQHKESVSCFAHGLMGAPFEVTGPSPKQMIKKHGNPPTLHVRWLFGLPLCRFRCNSPIRANPSNELDY